MEEVRCIICGKKEVFVFKMPKQHICKECATLGAKVELEEIKNEWEKR